MVVVAVRVRTRATWPSSKELLTLSGGGGPIVGDGPRMAAMVLATCEEEIRRAEPHENRRPARIVRDRAPTGFC